LLILEVAREIYASYPTVKYYAYGTYFGASESMRRFKRKFLFYPHRVTWKLETPSTSESREKEDADLIYSIDISRPPVEQRLSVGQFFLATGVEDIAKYWVHWKNQLGWRQAIKTSLKILNGRRIFFGVIAEDRLIQSGWANLGFCRYYSVEEDAVVLGT